MSAERFPVGGRPSVSPFPNQALQTRVSRMLARGMIAVFLYLAPSAAWSQAHVPFADRGMGQKVGLVAGSTACSVLYTPAKAVYATGGALAGSLVFLMSAGQSSAAAGRIFDRTGRGDWYVHPDHLTGVRPLHFRGETVGTPGTGW